MALIDIYFHDEFQFLTNLVTKDFGESALIQLHFLKTYIVLKDTVIKETKENLIENP